MSLIMGRFYLGFWRPGRPLCLLQIAFDSQEPEHAFHTIAESALPSVIGIIEGKSFPRRSRTLDSVQASSNQQVGRPGSGRSLRHQPTCPISGFLAVIGQQRRWRSILMQASGNRKPRFSSAGWGELFPSGPSRGRYHSRWNVETRHAFIRGHTARFMEQAPLAGLRRTVLHDLYIGGFRVERPLPF